MTKRVQVSVRRKVFDHAVRLPLHRVYELKSGGVASILREDAGGVADLIFSMLYNPWRAIIQLLGSLTDPQRLSTGNYAAWIARTMLPTVWLTHIAHGSAESGRFFAISATPGRRWIRMPPKRLAACAWCGPFSRQQAEAGTCSPATGISWPARKSSPGGPRAESNSPGRF